jgi:hypothetical protein
VGQQGWIEMMKQGNGADGGADPAEVIGAAPGKPLAPAARRALEEAAQRRQEIDARAKSAQPVPERRGRGGLEPVRYADWEIKGLAADF